MKVIQGHDSTMKRLMFIAKKTKKLVGYLKKNK